MATPLTLFQLGDVITGEPHLHAAQWFADRRDLSQLEQSPREFRLRTAAAMHLPRIILIAWGAAGILFWLSGFAVAG